MPTKGKTAATPKRRKHFIVRMPVDMQEWIRKQAETETGHDDRIVMRALVAERAKLEQSAQG